MKLAELRERTQIASAEIVPHMHILWNKWRSPIITGTAGKRYSTPLIMALQSVSSLGVDNFPSNFPTKYSSIILCKIETQKFLHVSVLGPPEKFLENEMKVSHLIFSS